jgi:hypothetical protein
MEQYEKISAAIGKACFWWIEIERLVRHSTLNLARSLSRAFDDDRPHRILDLAVGTLDMRQKIVVAKAYAHLIPGPHPEDLYDRVEALFNYIDNEVRPERNRYVHDQWGFIDDAAFRLNHSLRIVRPQARKRQLRLHTKREYQQIDLINEFVKNLQYVIDDLNELNNHIDWLISHIDQPSKSLRQFPPSWKSLTHRDWREPDKQ